MIAFCRFWRSLLDSGAGRGGLAGGQQWRYVKGEVCSHATPNPCICITISWQSCKRGRADGTCCSCSGGESFLQPPRRFMLLNCCFEVLLPLFPLALVSNCLRNCWELSKLPNRLPNKHLHAESHTRCSCHQSSCAAERGLSADAWEP